MKVFIEKENKQIVLDKECTAKDLLVELSINPTTVILVKNNETILLDEKLSKDDEVKILSVVSGG
jgi:sulfur carrier protein ThiS